MGCGASSELDGPAFGTEVRSRKREEGSQTPAMGRQRRAKVEEKSKALQLTNWREEAERREQQHAERENRTSSKDHAHAFASACSLIILSYRSNRSLRSASLRGLRSAAMLRASLSRPRPKLLFAREYERTVASGRRRVWTPGFLNSGACRNIVGGAAAVGAGQAGAG